MEKDTEFFPILLRANFQGVFYIKKLLKKVTFLNSGENTKSTEELNSNIFVENRLLNLVCLTNCLTVKGFALVF